jgi:phage gp29-like protein
MADSFPKGEIAVITGGRDVTRGFLPETWPLQPQDQVLRAKGGDYAVYEWVMQDDQVKSTFQQRRLKVIAAEWDVIPGGEKRIDRKAAESLERQLEGLGCDRVTDKMLFGIFYGFAVAELIYARDGAEIVIDQVKVRKQRRFRFGLDQRPRLVTMASPLEGEALPERKFWTFSTGADNDDEPYGLGLAHWLYWPVWFKRHDVKFWLAFLEKFGAPTAKATYPPNTNEADKKRLLEAAGAVASEAAIAVPEGTMIELLEAKRSGAADYAALHDAMDKAIAKIVLSQTMTTEDGSSEAQARVHAEVMQAVTKSDADLVCDSFNRGPARWLTEWNYPGAAIPKLWRRTEGEPDLKPQAERDEILHRIGWRAKPEYIAETYGDNYVESSQPSAVSPQLVTPGKAGTQPGEEQPEFADADRADAADDAVRQALEDEGWEELMAPIAAPLERAFAEATSYDDLRARLSAAFAEMDDAKLAELLGRSKFSARLAGRAGEDLA